MFVGHELMFSWHLPNQIAFIMEEDKYYFGSTACTCTVYSTGCCLKDIQGGSNMTGTICV
jgi:hypothetical protein